MRAAELAGTPRVYEQTLDRDYVVDLMRRRAAEMPEGLRDAPDPDTFDMGCASSAITTVVDVRAQVGRKRAAMAAHASQIPPDSFFLQLPPDAFREAFGWEWFIRRGPRPPGREDSLFP